MQVFYREICFFDKTPPAATFVLFQGIFWKLVLSNFVFSIQRNFPWVPLFQVNDPHTLAPLTENKFFLLFISTSYSLIKESPLKKHYYK